MPFLRKEVNGMLLLFLKENGIFKLFSERVSFLAATGEN
jgi:hypothetical protein